MEKYSSKINDMLSNNPNETEIYYDKKAQKLVFDATKSGNDGWTIKEEAPFSLDEGELLSLDIFVDKSAFA